MSFALELKRCLCGIYQSNIKKNFCTAGAPLLIVFHDCQISIRLGLVHKWRHSTKGGWGQRFWDNSSRAIVIKSVNMGGGEGCIKNVQKLRVRNSRWSHYVLSCVSDDNCLFLLLVFSHSCGWTELLWEAESCSIRSNPSTNRQQVPGRRKRRRSYIYVWYQRDHDDCRRMQGVCREKPGQWNIIFGQWNNGVFSRLSNPLVDLHLSPSVYFSTSSLNT